MLKLKELRIEKKLKQTDLCKALNLKPANYNRYETGAVIPPLAVLIRLADFYGVSLDFVVGRETPNNDYGFSRLSQIKQEVMSKIAQAPDTQVYRLDAYIDVLSHRDIPKLSS